MDMFSAGAGCGIRFLPGMYGEHFFFVGISHGKKISYTLHSHCELSFFSLQVNRFSCRSSVYPARMVMMSDGSTRDFSEFSTWTIPNILEKAKLQIRMNRSERQI
ncbi:MAG: hypothetical protein MJ014_04460, partial [Methanocorpusculum sp.]|nr:hypothetical protein [Methanocorpusculum sp.]